MKVLPGSQAALPVSAAASRDRAHAAVPGSKGEASRGAWDLHGVGIGHPADTGKLVEERPMIAIVPIHPGRHLVAPGRHSIGAAGIDAGE
ncbi:MAG: hypothetical protein F4213_18305 [Boseongicola sp. SB0677_bin_26]|nr:hypothetical protein [Boseongicola sp. SB0677_bin_26]